MVGIVCLSVRKFVGFRSLGLLFAHPFAIARSRVGGRREKVFVDVFVKCSKERQEETGLPG